MHTGMFARVLMGGASLALALALAGCGGTTPSTNEADDTQEATETVDEAYLNVTGVDFDDPDSVVASGDFDAMNDLADSISDYGSKEAVVDVVGEYGTGTLEHTIMVTNADGTQRVGIQFEVVGFSDSDYPAEGTAIHIVGVIRAIGPDSYTIVVPADQFEVVEEG